jgi:hypothetical protein
LEKQKDKDKAELTDEVSRLRNKLAFKVKFDIFYRVYIFKSLLSQQTELESSKLQLTSFSVNPGPTQNIGISPASSEAWPHTKQLTMKPNSTTGRSITSPRKDNRLHLPSPTKVAPTFPNFQNAFQRTSPKRMQSHRSQSPRKLNDTSREYENAGVTSQEERTTDIHGVLYPPVAAETSDFIVTSTSRKFNPWAQRLKNVSRLTPFMQHLPQDYQMRTSFLNCLGSTGSERWFGIQTLLSWAPTESEKILTIELGDYDFACRKMIDFFLDQPDEEPRVTLLLTLDSLATMGSILLKAGQVSAIIVQNF